MMKIRHPHSFLLSLIAAALLLSGALQPAFGQAVDRPDPVREIIPWGDGHAIKGEALVQFKTGFSALAQEALHEQAGTEKVRAVADGLDLVRFDDRAELDAILAKYESDPAVEFAEPNIVYWPVLNPNDSYFSQQWGPKKINCPGAWDVHTGNASHLCAMVDTGMDMDHSDLQSQYAGGYDYYSGDSNPNDTDGHGTHTAGTVAARTNNALGVAGVAWSCKLLIYRAGNYYFSTDACVSSINAASSAGALAVSMSWGGPQSSSSIRNALVSANNAGVVCVAAAGNDGSTAYFYPAAESPVIAVAATDSSDNKASFSNYGSWVEVAAPGVSILSTYVGNQYANADGTSMACPHVAGMATLLYSKLGGVRSKANADRRVPTPRRCVAQAKFDEPLDRSSASSSSMPIRRTDPFSRAAP